jgi:hypothetical protein
MERWATILHWDVPEGQEGRPWNIQIQRLTDLGGALESRFAAR